MPTCVFKTDEVRRCIEHALNATAWSMGWLEEETPGPALFFVHDQGVYLMSNGEPKEIADNGRNANIAYAKDCNPDTDEDWWDNSRDLVGGDDFAETLPITQKWLRDCGRYKNLEITVTGTEITCKFTEPRAIVHVA